MAPLLRERVSDRVEILRLNRPDRLNAMDSDLLGALNGALTDAAADERLCALVISTTSDAALSAGADVGEELDEATGVARMEAFARMYTQVSTFPLPTIAVCVGHCVGAGAELAAACDLRVAGENLKARWVGAVHGVPVGPARLVPLLGAARATDLILSGRRLLADEALAIGFARSVHPPGDAEGAALKLAAELAERDPEHLRRMKALMRDLDGLGARVEVENRALVEFQRSGAGLPRR